MIRNLIASILAAWLLVVRVVFCKCSLEDNILSGVKLEGRTMVPRIPDFCHPVLSHDINNIQQCPTLVYCNSCAGLGQV
jgi:hypothetical protein